MILILSILQWILEIYTAVIIIGAVLSWLIAFDVINLHNDAARNVVTLIAKVTEPIYVHIRKVIPPIGGLDLSPLILLIAISFVDHEINLLILRSLIY
jgi:YggT family protein